MPVMLIGHGGWDVSGEPAYAKMPRGTSITFYTDNLKLLRQDNAAEITNLSQLFKDAQPNQTVEAFKSSPNYTLSELEPDLLAYMQGNLAVDVTPVFVTADTRLCEGDGTTCGDGFHDCTGLLSRPDVVGKELMWVACRHVQLNEVGGLLAGVNQGSAGVGTGVDYVMPGMDSSGLTQGGNEYYEQFSSMADDEKLQKWLALDPTDTERLLLDGNIRSWWEENVR
jgi:hypothetical protein